MTALSAVTALLAEASVFQRFLEYPLYQWGLAGGLAVAVLGGLLSPLVVLKRLAFIGQGISHAAFGGVGAALLIGLFVPALREPLPRDAVVAAFCVAVAVGIGALSRRGRLSEDTAIGIVLAGTMALGVVLIEVRAWLAEALIRAGELTRTDLGYAPGFHDILFGDILLLAPADVYVGWALAAVVAVGLVLLFKELLFMSFDVEAATVFGVPTSAVYYGLLVALGLTVVLAMRAVGVILAGAVLILPGAAARCLGVGIRAMILCSVALAVAGTAGGFFLAIWLSHVSPGPVIALSLFVLFAVCWLIGTIRQRRS